ncbi:MULTISPECIES: DUF3472 domain-containing protein [Salegentibacter]|uniref:DUF5077 domain-containing protein n=2 Tax=Salegentibacter TaxID=143222 RepID=A0A1I2JWB8_9FLAO|nr:MULTISPECIES: DUF3472 domain-containing protein [Salegentibacter]APS39158.1 hypothetical protein AO058_09850 [Salegentibacter sp. T436]SFF58874.1 protein of unknown function [Salegentibacter agarivorans]
MKFNIYKVAILITYLGIFLTSCTQDKEEPEYTYQIPLGENSWISNNQEEDRKIIKKEGVHNWDGKKPIQSYFRTNKSGLVKLGLNLKSTSGNTKLKVSLAGESHEIQVKNKDFQKVYLGEFELEDSGYQQVSIKVIEPESNEKITIKELLLAGSVTEGEVNFVEDNFHFGRRGPSVHLRYPIPEESKKPTYFYNEIVVPQGEDVIGSYYMANGFSHGYFGMQVNSENERRILFSVWSPYETQNPDEIPEDQKIIMLKKGDDVYTGEFGNEGSGGQSFKKFMWKTNTTYKFLLKGEPAGPNHTDYSAYFYTPENNEWELIASFRRPKSSNYLGRLYSFLENFVPATGDISRKAHYKNQWLYDEEQGWIEFTETIFTADATANQKHRLDYAGGETTGGYYLKNCGFFNETTEVNTNFEREATGNAPQINFENLP